MRKCSTCGAVFRAARRNVCPIDQGVLIEAGDPIVGQTLGGAYRVVEPIGQGGMSTVYRGVDVASGNSVAIKILAAHFWQNDEYRQRVLREAKAANRVQHPHVVSVLDAGTLDDGGAYLVMEYLTGRPLSEVLSSERVLPVRRALSIALQVAHALAHTHRAQVIHRDIKPGNVFLLDGYGEDFVRLLDFGVAKVKGELTLTASGVVFGTPRYIAPEQACGSPLTGASDLYSLGVILYEMLAGRPPFTADSDDQLIMQHLSCMPVSPCEYQPSLPRLVADLVLSLLQKSPESRPTAKELAETLSAILENDPSADGRVEHAKSLRATVPQADPGRPEEHWELRLQFAEASGRPGQGAVWADACNELSRCIREVREARAKLYASAVSRAKEGYERERSGHQLARAIGALESEMQNIAKQQNELNARADELEEQVAESRRAARAWLDGGATRVLDDGHDTELLEQLAEAGSQARSALDLSQQVDAVRREIAQLAGRHEALSFQASQLRGRQGVLRVDDAEPAGTTVDPAAIALERALEAVERSGSRLELLLQG